MFFGNGIGHPNGWGGNVETVALLDPPQPGKQVQQQSVTAAHIQNSGMWWHFLDHFMQGADVGSIGLRQPDLGTG